jgi:hypothetical protein
MTCRGQRVTRTGTDTFVVSHVISITPGVDLQFLKKK